MKDFFDLPKLGFGAMRLPCIEGDGSRVDIDALCAMVDKYMAAGFMYFDTAYYYHNVKSEGALKEALVKRYPRQSYRLADKMPLTIIDEDNTYESVFNAQLERAGVDYFDYYLLHNLTGEQMELTEQKGGWDFIKRKKQEGKVRHIGFSCHDNAQRLDAVLTAHPETEFVQLQINYLDWEDENVQSRLCYEAARRHNVPVIVMEPVKGGALANPVQNAAELLKQAAPDKSCASWAIRYAAGLEGVFMVLSGMSNRAQVEDNLATMSNFAPLSQSEQQLLIRVRNIINNSTVVPCTGCGYCVAGCPMQINIPGLFRFTNDVAINPGGDRENEYQALLKHHGAPEDCIGCAACEGSCPQHIKITELLQKVRTQFGERC